MLFSCSFYVQLSVLGMNKSLFFEGQICAWLQVLLFAEAKDYDSVKSLYLDAAKHFKGKVANHIPVSLVDGIFISVVLMA